ncbi:MAG: hypothetical protein MZV70_52800 [Desulfobacterales bacterium]|nr:hypothetical protein [Desulfobacterales bacterium]
MTHPGTPAGRHDGRRDLRPGRTTRSSSPRPAPAGMEMTGEGTVKGQEPRVDRDHQHAAGRLHAHLQGQGRRRDDDRRGPGRRLRHLPLHRQERRNSPRVRPAGPAVCPAPAGSV